MMLTGGGALLRDLDRLLAGRNRPAGAGGRRPADLRGARLRHGAGAHGAPGHRSSPPSEAGARGSRGRLAACRLRHAGPHGATAFRQGRWTAAAAVLLPGPSALIAAGVLLGAGAVPDGRRRALRVAQPVRALRMACCRARWPLPVQLLAARQRLPARPEPGPGRRERAAAARAGPAGRRALQRSSSWPRENARLRAAAGAAPALQRAQPSRPRCCTTRPTPTRARSSSTAAATQGVAPGAPVIDEAGVLGQVTRVLPAASRGHAGDRPGRGHSGAQHAAPGAQRRPSAMPAATAAWSCASWPANADVQVGDLLHTSGLDGVYPPGLPVAEVGRSSARAESGFARIAAAAGQRSPDGVRHVLVLEPLALQMPQRRVPTPGRTRRQARRRQRR